MFLDSGHFLTVGEQKQQQSKSFFNKEPHSAHGLAHLDLQVHNHFFFLPGEEDKGIITHICPQF